MEYRCICATRSHRLVLCLAAKYYGKYLRLSASTCRFWNLYPSTFSCDFCSTTSSIACVYSTSHGRDTYRKSFAESNFGQCSRGNRGGFCTEISSFLHRCKKSGPSKWPESVRYDIRCFVISIALSRPRALLRVSWYSASGTLSATIPAPAWT